MKKVLSILLFLSLSLQFVKSQIPQGFNFQAVARDAQGEVLASQTISVRFGILLGSTTVWQEDHDNIETSDFGLFSVIIGDEDASKTGGTLSSFSDIVWGSGNFSLKVSLDPGSGFVSLGTSPIMSVPYALYAESGPKQAWSMQSDTLYTSTAVAIGSSPSGNALLSVQSDDPQVDKPLFEVKNDAGNPVFAVYNDGVIVFVDEDKKGVKGGFAVGGYNSAVKGMTQEFMRITPDSVRIWVPEDNAIKGVKGGFAVGGYNSATKTLTNNFLEISSSNTNIYFDTTAQQKGVKGGFAVGGYSSAQKSDQSNSFLIVSPDSTRVYVNNNPDKGVKGGFAVGGYNSAVKGDDGNFMSLQKENYFIGHRSGSKVTWGLYNSVMGYESGLNITEGSNNAFLGYQTGFSNINGSNNAFLGYQAGFSNNWGSGNLFLGYQAGYHNEGGVNNTFLGNSAGYNNNGPHNTFLGSFTGYNNVSGGLNTFVGDSTGFSNTIGYSNTFMGTSAGFTNTTGYSNVMIGNKAGYKNTIGSFNVFLGHESGKSNLDGASNVFVGTYAGHLNTIGHANIFIGAGAGKANTSGYSNLMIGTDAGAANDSGSFNVFLGFESGLANLDGGNNIYLGMRSGLKTIDGEGNVFLGFESGKDNVHGKWNVYIGNRAGSGSTGNGKLFISNQEADSSQSLIWGDFFGKYLRFNSTVGIGMHPEWVALSVNHPDNAGYISVYGDGNGYDYSGILLNADTADKTNTIALKHTVNDAFEINQRIGEDYFTRLVIDNIGNAGLNGWPGYQNLVIWDKSGVSDLQLKGVGDTYDYASISLSTEGLPVNKYYNFVHTKTDDLLVAYNDGDSYSARIKISSDGKISINSWDAATETLDVNGNARFRSVGAAAGGMDLLITPEGVLTTSTSDARLKANIQPLLNSLNKVLLLKGVTYNWKEDEDGKKDAGLIAQDVAEIYPEAVFVNPIDGYYGINYSRFPALFVEAFKEQQEIIDSQKNEIDDLKRRLERLESLLSQ